MKLSNENIEEYLLLLADNELEEAEEREVRLYIAQHQAYKPMLDAYLATRLDSTETFVFPDKESLLQPESVVVPLRKTSISPLKIAAAIVVLLGISAAVIMMFSQKETVRGSNTIAVKEHSNRNNTSVPVNAVTDSLPLPQVAKANPKKTNKPRNKSQQEILQNSHDAVAETKLTHPKIPVPVYLENAALNKVSTSAGVQSEAIAMIEKDNTEEAHTAMPEWLPVNEENLQGVNNLIAHIQELKENIQEKTKAFKNAAFVIRIGEKEIQIGK